MACLCRNTLALISAFRAYVLMQRTGTATSPSSKSEACVLMQMAVAFAEMHDTPTRMVAKGVLHGIVPWNCARPFLAIRLRRR